VAEGHPQFTDGAVEIDAELVVADPVARTVEFATDGTVEFATDGTVEVTT
jgi:hypothetical protein